MVIFQRMDYVIQTKTVNLALTGISRKRTFSFGTQQYIYFKGHFYYKYELCNVGRRSTTLTIELRAPAVFLPTSLPLATTT